MADEVSVAGGSGDGGSEAIEDSPSINVAGLISIIVFYLVVLLIGLWAGWKQRKVAKQQGRSSNSEEEVMLAGRDIGLLVGIMTMGGMKNIISAFCSSFQLLYLVKDLCFVPCIRWVRLKVAMAINYKLYKK